jgi:hypothetical protein
MLKDDEPDEHQQRLIDEKRSEYEDRIAQHQTDDEGDFPAGSKLCNKCQTKAMIQMDGCLTCLNCGESKCG